MIKIGQIWSWNKGPHMKIKILGPLVNGGYYEAEVVERDESRNLPDPCWVKGYRTHVWGPEERYTLYCTRYEEK